MSMPKILDILATVADLREVSMGSGGTGTPAGGGNGVVSKGAFSVAIVHGGCRAGGGVSAAAFLPFLAASIWARKACSTSD